MKKQKQNIYFTQDTEDAIVEYINSTDDVYKNLLYSKKIHPAFYKLAEIMIHRFKFYNFDVPHEDIKHEVISFLHEKIHKYKSENGKAFSYFSIVAKHYLIAENNKIYYHFKRSHGVELIDLERNVANEQYKIESVEEKKDFIDMFTVVMEKYLTDIFLKQRDLQVADTVLYLFKSRENIENYNKKAIYILVRERTGVNSQYITNVINRIKKIYFKLYSKYKDAVNIELLTLDELKNIINN